MVINNGTDIPFYRRAKSILLDSPLEILEVVIITNAPYTFNISPIFILLSLKSIRDIRFIG